MGVIAKLARVCGGWLATALVTSSAIGSARAADTGAVEICPGAPSPALADASRWIRHEVAIWEDLDQIAYRYDVKPARLRAWNGLDEEARTVSRGRQLRIWTSREPPARRKVRYEVRDGDTWSRIAAIHGVDEWELRSYNWPYQDKMAPGSVLSVWIDPVVYAWIHARPPVVPPGGSGRVRRGGVGIGVPDEGRLINGVQIPPGEGYAVRVPAAAYGTTHAVQQLVTAIGSFRATSGYEGVLDIGVMSSPRGGPLGHHRSHQSGRDVDIRLPRRVDTPPGFPLTPKRIDWGATWALIRALSAADTLVVFLDYEMQGRVHKAAVAAGASEDELQRLLQYPRGHGAHLGLVRHSPGHDQHLHARFDCGPCELECARKPGMSDE